MRRTAAAFAAITLAVASLATPASAASLFFDFDEANSSITLSNYQPGCLPFSGCQLTTTVLPLADQTIEEGQSETFEFGLFQVSPGFGGDLFLRVEAILAFTAPDAPDAEANGTGSYIRAGGFFRPGLLTGALIWDNPTQTVASLDGSEFTVTFGDILGFSQGQAFLPVTVGVNSVAAVPEPATWAVMIAGFGLAGATLRRRRVTYAVR